MQVKRIDVYGEAGYVVIGRYDNTIFINGYKHGSRTKMLRLELYSKASPVEVYDAAQRVHVFIEDVEGTNTDVMIVRNLIETVMT